MKSLGQKYCEYLELIITEVIPVLESLGEEHLEFKEANKKWNRKVILGHLIDSAYNNHQRFLRVQGQQNLVFRGYDQDLWADSNRYASREAHEVINTFKVVQLHLALLIGNLEDELILKVHKVHNLDKIGMSARSSESPTPLSFLIWDYLFHLEHHLAQIIPNYESLIPTEYLRT